ncbi:hypothetical protein PR048_021651 [Dryococelus australis]|uniref:DUF4371 domain-containing protein n=1 Tax=Dryococelus australis TaxID=614101 RepID=A0ABQ9GYW5_9NEOP|nr:hypothetical protein PR048_021651 [Dryococelus australis]
MKEETSKRIHKSGMYSIIVNKARCFKEEQISVALHYPKSLHPQEKLIDFVNCSKARDSTSLAATITDVLHNLPVKGMVMVAQSYDGVSVMSGKHNRVQAKIKEQHPQATYIHCMPHRVNLVITDACSHIRMVMGFFNIIESLYIHYSKCSTRSKFLEVQKLLGLKIKELGSLTVIQALSEEIEEGKGKDVTATRILSSIKPPNFIVCWFTMDYVLSLMNVLSNYFQKEEATLGASARLVKSTLATLKEQRDKFDDVWIPIEKFAEEHDLTLSAPKASKKRKPNTSHTLQDYVVESTLGQTVTLVDGEALD